MAATLGRRRHGQVLDEILRYLRAGLSRRAACGLAGIHRTALDRWFEHSTVVLRQIQQAEA